MLKYKNYISNNFLKIYFINLKNPLNITFPTMWDFLFEVLKSVFWGDTKPSEPKGDCIFPEIPQVYPEITIKQANKNQELSDNLKESIDSYIKDAVDRAVNDSIKEIVERTINDESFKKDLHSSLENSLFDSLESSLRESLNDSRDEALLEEANLLNEINVLNDLQIDNPQLVEVTLFNWQCNCHYFTECGVLHLLH